MNVSAKVKNEKAILIQKNVRRWLCKQRYDQILADKIIQVLLNETSLSNSFFQ